MKVEAPKKLEAQETNQIGSAVKKREAQWRRVDSMHAMNLLLIEIFVQAKWSRIEILNQPKSHPPTNPLTASFSTEDGFQKSGLESRKRRSLREKDDFGIKFKRAGYPNLKINQKWNESYKKLDGEEISKSLEISNIIKSGR